MRFPSSLIHLSLSPILLLLRAGVNFGNKSETLRTAVCLCVCPGVVQYIVFLLEIGLRPNPRGAHEVFVMAKESEESSFTCTENFGLVIVFSGKCSLNPLSAFIYILASQALQFSHPFRLKQSNQHSCLLWYCNKNSKLLSMLLNTFNSFSKMS